jgi:hypothetical protein
MNTQFSGDDPELEELLNSDDDNLKGKLSTNDSGKSSTCKGGSSEKAIKEELNTQKSLLSTLRNDLIE